MSQNNENEMLHLINQAKSEARSEVIKKFFNKNAKVLSVASIVAVVGLVSYGAFNFYQNSQEAKFSEIFHQALIDQQIGETTKAKESLQKISESSAAPKGVKSLAALRYAAMLLSENKKSEAAEVYQKISQCSGCDSYVKDLGGLLAIKVWLSDETEIVKEDLLARIETIEARSKELRYQISEQKALLYFQKNDLAKAYEILDAIAKNPEVTPDVKNKVSEGLKIIIAKGYQPEEEIAAAPAESDKK